MRHFILLRPRLALKSCGTQTNHVEPARRPQCSAAIEPQRAERVGLGEPFDGEARNTGDGSKPLDAGKAVAARGHEFVQFVFVEPMNEAKAEANGVIM